MSAFADIVIVNWNSGRLLRDCLQSIGRHSQGIAKTIVVDNGSSDGSDSIDDTISPLEIIRTGRNLGFAKACNLGAERTLSTYILFLNPDTRLLDDSVARVLAFMESPQGRGIGVCGVRLVGALGEPRQSCMAFPTAAGYFLRAVGLGWLPIWPARVPGRPLEPDGSQEVDQVIGAFFLIRRDLFLALGGFDERFFVYLEEVDLCFRMKAIGWPSYHLREATAYHLENGTTDQVKDLRLFYMLRSRLLYGMKHFSKPSVLLLFLTTLVIEPITRLLRAVVRLSVGEIGATLRAYGKLYRALPKTLSVAYAGRVTDASCRSASAVKLER